MSKAIVDYGPLAAFVIAYKLGGMAAATATLMVAAAGAVLFAYLTTKTWPVVPMVTAVIVGIFGGLTLWLKDDSFIKMKPSILYGLFAVALVFGLATKRLFLKHILGSALPLDEAGWRILSWRAFWFFAALAGANEVARRLLTTDQWVWWKVGGVTILLFLFLFLNLLSLRSHLREPGNEAE